MGTLEKRGRSGVVAAALVIVLVGLFGLGLPGCGSSASSEESSPELEAALADYRGYLQENAAELARRVAAMQRVIVRESGKEPVPAAESVYPAPRVSFGHIDPFVQLHPPLQRAIDGLEEEVPPEDYGGFHQIEKQIYWQKVTTEMEPVGKQLEADIEELREQIDSADLQPSELALGARKTVDRLVEHAFPGDIERWSHLDMVDAGAQTEGVDKVFRVVKLPLAEENSEMAKQLEEQIEEAIAEVDEYGTLARDSDPSEPLRAGTGFYVYDQVTQDKRWNLTQSFKELSDLLAQAEEELGDS